MNSITSPPTEILSSLVTGRSEDLFTADMGVCQEGLYKSIAGARILVIGGAGSIGSATVRLLTQLEPRSLHIVDQNENRLAELVRDIRSSREDFRVADFRTFPIDYGSSLMHRFLSEMDSYELVFNFAALKHVRSEKDTYSLLQMLDTNVIKPLKFLGWLAGKSAECKYFCVSTDKAANPASLMGASKRIMEHLIFSTELVPNLHSHVTSARFANVAFSDGSLLDSFLRRLQRRQPLAVPRDTRRYFISLSESGQICLIAAVSAPNRHILISRLDQSRDLRDLEAVARAIIQKCGFEPQIYEEATEAKLNLESDIEKGRYPLVLTDRDTGGEKSFEEFVGKGEKVVDLGLPNLLAVPYVPQRDSLTVFLETIGKFLSDPQVSATKSTIVELIAKVVPEFSHISSDKNLDDRM